MNNKYLQIVILIVLAGLALFVIPRMHNTPSEEQDNIQPEVIAESPKYGQLVSSPLMVKGMARGNWFFEANLPVTLKDEQGNVLAKVGLQAQDNWMTTDYVPFEGILEFGMPATEFGVLIIEKDNPSGNAQFDASFAVPVRFK